MRAALVLCRLTLLVAGVHDMNLAGSILAVATAVLVLAPMAPAQKDLTTSGIRFWVETRRRHPHAGGVWRSNNYFNSYQLGTNSFRGFTANGCHGSTDKPNCTQAIDGTAVWDATATDPSSSYHENVLYGQLNGSPGRPIGLCVDSGSTRRSVPVVCSTASLMEKIPHSGTSPQKLAVIPVHTTKQ